MRYLALTLTAVSLAGCNSGADSSYGPHRGGRYQGVGIYTPGALWQAQAGAGRPADAAAATLADDEHVIVVVDSQTGEMRQCGDLSGRCIASNPWTGPPAPVRLTAHVGDLESSSSATNAVTSTEDEAPAPARTPPRTSPH
jgi:hypothetical protein